MPQRRKNPRVASRSGLVIVAILMAGAAKLCWAQENGQAPQLEPNSVIGAMLCFAVGVGACLLVVRAMLPTIVHTQCVEIVRDYMEFIGRESEIRVVVVDRETHQSVREPTRERGPAEVTSAAASYEPTQHRRIDKPIAPSAGAMTGAADTHGEEAPNSMLKQIYEQNLHLREQMRKQSRSVKQ